MTNKNIDIISHQIYLFRIIFFIAGTISPLITYLWMRATPELTGSPFWGWVMFFMFNSLAVLSYKFDFIKYKLVYIGYISFTLMTFSPIYFAYKNNFAEGYSLLLFLVILMVSQLFRETKFLLIYEGLVFFSLVIAFIFNANHSLNAFLLVIVHIMFSIISYFILRSYNNIINKLNEEKLKAEEESISKSTFLAKLSHEVRNNLNGIFGVIQIISMRELNRTEKELLKLIEVSSKSIISLLNDVLVYSKLKSEVVSIHNESFELRTFINELTILHSIDIDTNIIKFSSKVNENLPEFLLGDKIRLKQVLDNIISNAKKYTFSGSITIVVGLNKESSIKTWISFSVIDTGVGIPEADIDKIFDDFLQATNTRSSKIEGTGLGLAIAKKIVEKMDGSISVFSKPNIETEFKITVPFEKQ